VNVSGHDGPILQHILPHAAKSDWSVTGHLPYQGFTCPTSAPFYSAFIRTRLSGVIGSHSILQFLPAGHQLRTRCARTSQLETIQASSP